MERYTQKQLGALVAAGAAQDITDFSFEQANALYNAGLAQIGYSAGIYGINGALFQDKGGNMYAITARNTTLFQLSKNKQ